MQHLSGIWKEVATCLSEFSTLRDSPEKSLLKAILQVLYVAAQCWLCRVESLCRLPEVALFGNGYKGDEVTELWALVHGCTNLIWLYSAGRSVRGQLMLIGKLLQHQ
jgi:hypothetical protein